VGRSAPAAAPPPPAGCVSLPRSPAQPSSTLAALRRAAAAAPHVVPAHRPLTPVTSLAAAAARARAPLALEPLLAPAPGSLDLSDASSVTGSVRSTEANFPPVPDFGAAKVPVPVASRLAVLAPPAGGGGGARRAAAAAGASPPTARRAAPPPPPPAAPPARPSPRPQYRVQALFGRAHVTRVVVSLSPGCGGGGGASPARRAPASARAPRLSPLHPALDCEDAPGAAPTTARAEALPPLSPPAARRARGGGGWDVEAGGSPAAALVFAGAGARAVPPARPAAGARSPGGGAGGAEMLRRYRPLGDADPVARYTQMSTAWGVFTPSPVSPRRAAARGAPSPAPPAPPADPLVARALAFRALLDTYGVPLEELKPGHPFWSAAKAFLAEGTPEAPAACADVKAAAPLPMHERSRQPLAALGANAARGGARRPPV
jgi:hypothetical protein